MLLSLFYKQTNKITVKHFEKQAQEYSFPFSFCFFLFECLLLVTHLVKMIYEANNVHNSLACRISLLISLLQRERKRERERERERVIERGTEKYSESVFKTLQRSFHFSHFILILCYILSFFFDSLQRAKMTFKANVRYFPDFFFFISLSLFPSLASCFFFLF